MTTVPLVDAAQTPLPARGDFADGDPGPIVSALAHVPELLEVALPFVSTVLGPSALSWRTKQLVIVRTSALLDCRYYVQTHSVLALDAGVTPTEIRALRGLRTIESAFDLPELALLYWTDLVALGPGTVPGGVRQELRKHWADHEVVELVMLVGATVMLNRFATTLELPPSEETLRRLTVEGLL